MRLTRFHLMSSRNILKTLLLNLSTLKYDLPPTQSSSSSYDRAELPLCTERTLGNPVFCSWTRSPRQAWLETLKPINEPSDCDIVSPIGIVDLHPDIFAVFPRIDLVHKNLYWQAHYRMVDWRCITTRAELPYRSNKKPWPQKGTGRARHGNRRTHIWVGGGQCKGPRGPESFFYLLPRDVRIAGLLTMLTIKHAQNDLHIVDDLRLSAELEQEANSVWQETLDAVQDPDAADPLSDPNRIRLHRFYKTMNNAAVYLRDLVDKRRWGPSVLFITDLDPSNFGVPSPGHQAPHPKSLLDHPSPGICLACSAYAEFIEAEISAEASAYKFESPAPRTTHPGRGLTLMPLQGLNVWSMVHHDTLVLPLSCLTLLENRLLQAQRTLVKDQSLESPLTLTPPSWLLALDYEQSHEEPFKSRGRRHFSERVDSAFWKRVKCA